MNYDIIDLDYDTMIHFMVHIIYDIIISTMIS